MAVMIKSIKDVPKSCNRCSLRSVYDRCGAHEYGEEDPNVLLHCVNETKPDLCPLIKVPDTYPVAVAFAKAHECCGGCIE